MDGIDNPALIEEWNNIYFAAYEKILNKYVKLPPIK